MPQPGQPAAPSQFHPDPYARGPSDSHETDSDAGQFDLARRDFMSGLSSWRLWLMLGWLDVRQRYRRSYLGPFWITLSMAIMTATMGIIYASLFKLDLAVFLPYIAAGFAVWLFISTTVNEASTLFVQAEGIIRNSTMPLSVHLFRLIWRNLIFFAHNLVVMIAVYLAFVGFSWEAIPVFFVGVVLLVINLTWISLIVGIVCTRFRDAPPIVSSLMQMAFFVTPILFKPALLTSDLTALAVYNPFFHLVEIVRAPLLGNYPEPETLIAVVALGAAGWAVTIRAYTRLRSRIAYWL